MLQNTAVSFVVLVVAWRQMNSYFWPFMLFGIWHVLTSCNINLAKINVHFSCRYIYLISHWLLVHKRTNWMLIRIAPIYLSTSDIPVVRNTRVFRKTSALSLSMNWSSAGTLWLFSDTSNCIPFYSVQEAAIVVIIVRLNGMTVIIKWAKYQISKI